MKTIREAVLVFVVLSLVTGVAYPLLITVVGQVVFPHEVNGSLIEREGKLIGSELIGQSFTDPKYFWGRPSAAGYNAEASTGSNLGPTNPAQFDAVKQRLADLQSAHGAEAKIPIDMVTASASGLDPHNSPAAAALQVNRVAAARKLSADQVMELVAEHTENRAVGVLGEPRVNVLKLNLALDEFGS
jgi:K+-transporting ATPase ATPase C chain